MKTFISALTLIASLSMALRTADEEPQILSIEETPTTIEVTTVGEPSDPVEEVYPAEKSDLWGGYYNMSLNEF